jgi:hypothetical protein
MDPSAALLGGCMVLMQLGAKNLSLELSAWQEETMQHPLVRRIILFAAVFIVTRNALLSLTITVAAVLAIHVLLRDGHPMRLLPTITPKDSGATPSRSQYTAAKAVIAKYEAGGAGESQPHTEPSTLFARMQSNIDAFLSS